MVRVTTMTPPLIREGSARARATVRSVPPSEDYDPWCDLNDDGEVWLDDLHQFGKAWYTAGEPVNKTALLYEVNDTFTELLSRIDDLETQVTELENTKLARAV